MTKKATWCKLVKGTRRNWYTKKIQLSMENNDLNLKNFIVIYSKKLQVGKGTIGIEIVKTLNMVYIIQKEQLGTGHKYVLSKLFKVRIIWV